jgi:hypothetical protein
MLGLACVRLRVLLGAFGMRVRDSLGFFSDWHFYSVTAANNQPGNSSYNNPLPQLETHSGIVFVPSVTVIPGR